MEFIDENGGVSMSACAKGTKGNLTPRRASCHRHPRWRGRARASLGRISDTTYVSIAPAGDCFANLGKAEFSERNPIACFEDSKGRPLGFLSRDHGSWSVLGPAAPSRPPVPISCGMAHGYRDISGFREAAKACWLGLIVAPSACRRPAPCPKLRSKGERGMDVADPRDRLRKVGPIAVRKCVGAPSETRFRATG